VCFTHFSFLLVDDAAIAERIDEEF
jgi:hypothetical protein